MARSVPRRLHAEARTGSAAEMKGPALQAARFHTSQTRKPIEVESIRVIASSLADQSERIEKLQRQEPIMPFEARIERGTRASESEHLFLADFHLSTWPDCRLQRPFFQKYIPPE